MPKTPSQKLAIFDLDYTILSIDSEVLWSEFLYKKNLVNDSFLQQVMQYYIDFENGALDMDGYQSFLNQPLLEIPQKTLFELRKKFLHKIKKNIRPKILKRIKHFRMNDFTILLISASNSFLVESIANVLGIENYLCTRLEIEGGSLTNKIEGIPAYREGKMELLKSWLSEHETEFIDTWAYSDSHNDLPMLEWVKNPVVTYPDHILRQIATTRGWPIID